MMPLAYFATPEGVSQLSAISMLIPFGLPGAGLLAFLVLTEGSRFKPWMKDRAMEALKKEREMMSGPCKLWAGLVLCSV
jgi:hypothetical protein